MKILSGLMLTFSLFFGLLFIIAPASAQLKAETGGEIGKQLGAAGGAKGAGMTLEADPRTIVYRIINVALSLIGTILFVLVFYSGYLWMTAGGNEEQVAQAKSILRNAVIGIIIVLMSWIITVAVTKFAQGRPLDGSGSLDPFEQTVERCVQGIWNDQANTCQ